METTMLAIDWFSVGIKSALGFLGVVAFAVWKVRMFLRVFSFRKFVLDNRAFWIWSITMGMIVQIILTISPETGGAIKTMIGLDVSNEPASFLLLGWSLSALAYQMSKHKGDTQSEE